ncbi:HupE/UreJ family protein [Desmospora activa]|uniref:Hydrogenase/urease accessory protein HupE n=1 Tax=Desmospora activa DSM 45169 TaxID=1121389 RepID=A0A2T4ZDE3_9BACL|nr:HupE/UreJ family protein [Desmospora activa]PTM59886.1 hydrogenase/urease accessory protein HupE [Desmospora activa DSM 45169]
MQRYVSLLLISLTVFTIATSFTVLFASPTSAHNNNHGYMDITLKPGEAHINLILDFEELSQLVDIPIEWQTASTSELEKILADRKDSLYQPLAAGVRVYRDEVPCTPQIVNTVVSTLDEHPLAEIGLLYPCDGDATRIRYDLFFEDINRSHLNIAQIKGEGVDQEFLFTIADRELEVGERNWLRQGWQFISLGGKHIFTGYDHILFVLSLLLIATRLLQTVEIATAFTLGHSITLGLATLGVVTFPERIVESIIALSIVFVASQILFKRHLPHQWIVALLFGLVHGFGFAGILQEMELSHSSIASSLLFFNVGVELGQIAIIAVAFPLLAYIRRYPIYPRIAATSSIAMIAIGLYWFIQRSIVF